MPTILCLTSYEKGQDYLRECAAAGARTLLLTVETLRDADWPRDVLADVYLLPSFDDVEHVTSAVSYLARSESIDRIVALDEFDMELAAQLREHLRVDGPGVTQTRATRDKLVMRELAQRAGLAVPAFIGIVNHQAIAEYLERTEAPWVLKPRTQASAIGIRKLEHAPELWPILEELGDRQSHHLLECYIPGDVYHVDGIASAGALLFAEVHLYAQPPFDTMHGGGIFCSRTVERGSHEQTTLRDLTLRLVRAVGLRDGVAHVEFIRDRESGDFYFLEIAARVGGAHIADMVEAATGVNLWREWARLELALAEATPYTAPQPRRHHAGVLICLAKQEWPDMMTFTDPEVVWRLRKRHHAGLIVASEEATRVRRLLDDYMPRFHADYYTSLPAPERATN
ncbi:MAG TPA: ATP-grasp domain-containing protein [Longimicrobiales bacterium]|nr:ATP-grasp domain-containing protein [Longimicrobiales bacterium]